MESYLNVFVYHILAGIIAVLISLSVVYKKLETLFGVHRKLNRLDIDKIVDESGKELSNEEREKFIENYNSLIYMGKNHNRSIDYDSGTTVYLHSGERIQIVSVERFYEIRRVGRKGRQVEFRLFHKQ